MSSTSLISGLSSGFDWQSMVTQLIEIEHSRVDIISDKQAEYEKKLSEWQSLNTKLLALKTAAGNLKDVEDFHVYNTTMSTDSSTVDASDLLTVTTSSSASVGSYTMTVNSLAAAQKLSSGSFASRTDALGADFAGDILINGTVISVASTDSLGDVKTKINNANSGDNPTGVTASIITYGTGDIRLILTSDETGEDGIGLLNGGAVDILNQFGFTDTSRTAKNHITGGDMSDCFTSTSVSIKSLLGLSSTQASEDDEIVINGLTIDAIDLSTDTLSSLQTKLSAAGLSASIVTEVDDDDQTYYRLLIDGASNTFTDDSNILETLGFIQGGVSDVYGVVGDTANTADGAIIDADSLIKDIDGYTGYTSTDYIHLEGFDTNGAVVTDDTLVLSDTTTIQDLLDKIESVFGDVTAMVTGDGKIKVVDNTTGSSCLAVVISVKDNGGADDDTLNFDADDDLGSATTMRKRELVAGADASVTVDGVTVSRSENTIDDIIDGVTLNLLAADTETTISLNIGRDIDSIMEKINTFVSGYNSIASYISEQTSYDETEQEAGGVLFGDGTLSSVKSDLTSILVQNVWGVSTDYSTMGLVGINVDRYGQLSVDESELRANLISHFNDIVKLFAADGTTSTGTLEYIGHGTDTVRGEYTVDVTQAATQSTSTASDNTSLSGDETLTITDGSKVATVSLTSGMTMTQIVNAVNDELDAVYTQILAGSEQLYADAGQAAAVTSSTTWNSIYDSSGLSANLEDGDEISFYGTLRNGGSMSGSYTIEDITSDTVQGLLSAIETAFGGDVTASINESGQIIITDDTTGASSISLTFNMTSAHDLDLGTVLATNTGGQTGRYAMDITASTDSGDHLVINSNSYGSDFSFMIQQQNNLLWTSGDQTVDNGLDVAGTINGEAATGSGQILKGDSDEANIDGLSIKYTGTASGEVGTVKLTYGVGELYDRTLYYITDTIDGYVTYKQQSLQESIASFETQIEELEERLAKKSEQMINRFVLMELALQKIQSQSNWLANQLSAADSGWK
ncbi:MAG: flagellar filament capping protein FliD [Deltaproteobacteria bacterium]|nr:flagellar filament capping protein FliD [Deltaproteobacteria bacterium]